MRGGCDVCTPIARTLDRTHVAQAGNFSDRCARICADGGFSTKNPPCGALDSKIRRIDSGAGVAVRVRVVKLYYTHTSPFVRKVRVVAHETGLDARIEPVFLRPTPTRADPTLSRENPLSKIPALVLDDGTSLYDSPVICEYLDGLHEGRKLIPASGEARWRVLRTQALADGILDAGILVFYERAFRPKELQWSPWLDGQTEKVTQGLDALEREAARFTPEIDLGQIAAAVTLAWLEFRNVVGDIRASRPTLGAWYETFRARPSMVATEPRDG